MDASFFEIDGVIVRTRPYYENGGGAYMISVDFIDDDKRVSLNVHADDFSDLLKFLNKELARAKERKLIP